MDAWSDLRLSMINSRQSEQRRDAAAERLAFTARDTQPVTPGRTIAVVVPRLRPTIVHVTRG